MKQHWKILILLLACASLVACATATADSTDNNLQAQSKRSVVTDGQNKTGQPSDTQSEKKHPVALSALTTSDGKLILGEKEWVYLPGLKENFRARIDTGATTSSISAVDIMPFKRDGKDWVKFRIQHDGIKSDEVNLPVERWAHIRQSNTDNPQRRPVIMVWIQIGDLKENTEFTLTDRTHLAYPLLLGRSFVRHRAVVDVSRKYVQPKHE